MSTGDITVQELSERLKNNEDLIIIDVREPFEHDMANIGGNLIPLGDLPNQLEQIEEFKDREIIVYCRSGARSGSACQYLRGQGFTNVRNMIGGMGQWVREIDPSMPFF
jgi:rhodanese-related sulfurtransferase